MSATVWGTNLYEGESVGDLLTTILCGKHSMITAMRCREGVRILANPRDVDTGEVFVSDCLFEGRVQYTSNIRFEHCRFLAGKPEVWVDPIDAIPETP
jgi:hypothetical protein